MGDKKYLSPRARAEAFTGALGIRLPILLAPMAGASPPSLSIAVANAGGLGACGALMMKPDEIRAWSAEFREKSTRRISNKSLDSRGGADARFRVGETAAGVSCDVGASCSARSGRRGAAGF